MRGMRAAPILRVVGNHRLAIVDWQPSRSHPAGDPLAYKQILFRSAAREKLLADTRALADAVRVT